MVQLDGALNGASIRVDEGVLGRAAGQREPGIK